MTVTAWPLPVESTAQLARAVPGYDAGPVINAGEQRLADYLAKPRQHVLQELGMPPAGGQAPAAPAAPATPANPAGAQSLMGLTSLISPVINALGTLGTGQFAGMDPTSMFNQISSAFDGAAGPVQQALGAVQEGWQGASSTAAAARTAAALANGAEVSTQAKGLQASLSAAVADVAQAQTQLIAIINEFLATLAAIGPNIIFPWGWAAVVAAAAQAVTQAGQVMTEVQSSLAAQASAVTAIGTPVNITAAPQLASMLAPASSTLGAAAPASAASPLSALSALSPLMSVATMGISPAMSAAGAAGNAGRPAAAAGAATGTLAGETDEDPMDRDGRAKPGHKPAIPVGSVAPAGGGGGGALMSRVMAPAAPAAPETTTVSSMPSPAPRLAAGAMPLGGGGMVGAPAAAAGHAAGGGAHTAPSFLHTSDQGGKVVDNRTTVAPPVIGEADPHEKPDIELRI